MHHFTTDKNNNLDRMKKLFGQLLIWLFMDTRDEVLRKNHGKGAWNLCPLTALF
ncbi:hypothetical protein [Paenibacillus xylanexedens]|uniref:hypothetical protein n=1 Tax=Paenibacillus xylanexedens TaxID=528191 RepID=UPI001643B2C7|nr:hypothetical protein [Paenibacillus xylanexedens]